MHLERVFVDVNSEQLKAILIAVAARLEGFSPGDVDQLCADAATLEHVKTTYAAQLAALPSAKLLVAPGCRHFIMLDNPTWFQATVDEFLRPKAKGK